MRLGDLEKLPKIYFMRSLECGWVGLIFCTHDKCFSFGWDRGDIPFRTTMNLQINLQGGSIR